MIPDRTSRDANERSDARSRAARSHTISVTLGVASLSSVLLLSLAVVARGDTGTLPVRTYRIVDGLLSDQVGQIKRDSHGYMWMCTPEGLSRFDGYGFTNYGMEQGLPSMRVNDIVETKSGVYWLATDKGACRFDPTASKDPLHGRRFTLCRLGGTPYTRGPGVLAETPGGKILCGTGGGLYQVELIGGRWKSTYVDLGIPVKQYDDASVEALLVDSRGTTWVGTASGLLRLWPDGHVDHYATRHGLPVNNVRALLQDRRGDLWVGTVKGLCRLVADPRPDERVVSLVIGKEQGMTDEVVTSLLETTDGKIWIGTYAALYELRLSEGGREARVQSYTSENGLAYPYPSVWALVEDEDGNLWLGTEDSGAMRIARNGFLSYGSRDGLLQPRIGSIFEDASGQLCVFTNMGGITLSYFDGRRFNPVRPLLPKTLSVWGWGISQVAFQDHAGEWWIPTGEGLYRYPRATRLQDLAHLPPRAAYTTRNGLRTNGIFRLFEDSRHDVWVAVEGSRAEFLSRWDRASDTFQHYSKGIPLQLPTAFCEDRAGNLWIGFYSEGVARLRDGRFESFGNDAGFAESFISQIFMDHAGRLWITTSKNGVLLVEDPSEKTPRVRSYTTRDGLSSMDVNCVTEDLQGRVYFGTTHGVDRLDPRTGRVRRYGTSDGLASSNIVTAFRDRNGTLWFGSLQGLSHLTPQPDRRRPQPPILISSVRANGVAYPVSDIGETEVAGILLGPGPGGIQIDYLGIDLGSDEQLRYQYMLEGVDREWGPATQHRAVSYARLGPGRYRFAVRAMSSDGEVSPIPATVGFTILPPLWQRWWFLASLVAVVGVVTYAFYRARVARLLELERVRTRIATDLHDDIGSSLSHIAILSEVASQRIDPGDKPVAAPLSRIAEVSRDLVDSMSDIVWSINPQKDHLNDLVLRMRRLADEVLTYREIAFQFNAPDSERYIRISAEFRRQVFLIFKEGLNNIVKHSGCTDVAIDLQMTRGLVEMKLADNGSGFDVSAKSAGHGLASMSARALSVGGALEVTSRPGEGTVMVLRVPLAPRRFSWTGIRQ